MEDQHPATFILKLQQLRGGATPEQCISIQQVQNYITEAVTKINDLQKQLRVKDEQICQLMKQLGDFKTTHSGSENAASGSGSLFSTPKNSPTAHPCSSNQIMVRDSLMHDSVLQPPQAVIDNYKESIHSKNCSSIEKSKDTRNSIVLYNIAEALNQIQNKNENNSFVSPSKRESGGFAPRAFVYCDEQVNSQPAGEEQIPVNTLNLFCDEEEEERKIWQDRRKVLLLKQQFSPIAEVQVEDGSTVKKSPRPTTSINIMRKTVRYLGKDQQENTIGYEQKKRTSKKYNYLWALSPYLN